MRRAYKFSELTVEVRERVIENYILGWEETHDKGDLSFRDAEYSLTNDDDRYTRG